MNGPRYAVIIPACNEEEPLPLVIAELQRHLDPAQFVIVIGANSCRDHTVAVAKLAGVAVAETPVAGYGHGCQAAIECAAQTYPTVEAFIFFAADGANDPTDIANLVAAHEIGHVVVLGQRTQLRRNWKIMTFRHVLANRILGAWCGLLTGRSYRDLGPLRLISRPVFEVLNMREWTYGWTIESQILCARLKIPVLEIDVAERPRVAGHQKVSGVSCRRTLQIGWQIFAAAWRARTRPLKNDCPNAAAANNLNGIAPSIPS